ncbi:hypothetical protein CSOJ01_08674 [Colletotrichum sojae]|uniref:Uncharacterized protein n=1 Tax=Colletotrichum sojae TaxID=2175907 RepID=A0A8H6MSL6_9PEZI|nr:hypothetical protein CSOJ01_08674 [Colletotrichum sojae]
MAESGFVAGILQRRAEPTSGGDPRAHTTPELDQEARQVGRGTRSNVTSPSRNGLREPDLRNPERLAGTLRTF